MAKLTRNTTEDDVVLSYFDYVIRQSDLNLLKNNNWLNDALIGFYIAYLEKEKFKDHDYLLFVGPEVTQCLKESPSSEVPIFLDPLEAKNKQVLFLAVNDSGKSAGGSHWSLLVYSYNEKKFYHVDSSLQSNLCSALKLANNLTEYFGIPLDVDFEELACLQQDNSYDCGIHLVCNLENIAQHMILNSGNVKHVPSLEKEIVNHKRKYLWDLIMKCKQDSKD